jgi:hypothetical protein
VDEARQIIFRLDRVEGLEREGAVADVLLAEVRRLVADAERWLEAEPSAPVAASAAVAAARAALRRHAGGVPAHPAPRAAGGGGGLW